MKSLFGKAMNMVMRIAPVAFVPWAFISPQSFFWGKQTTLKPNVIDERVHEIQLESNLPCEDRKDVIQLQSIEGYAAAVYDGHGGWQSDLCSKELLLTLDKCLNLNKQSNKYPNIDDLIKQSIKDAFLTIESRYIEQARIAYGLGFGKAARAGSCALICVVHNNKLYCGNAGDSKGIIVEENIPMGYVEINRFLNADNPDQQKRLKQTFPNENDIVFCKRPDNTSCYVKGRLQPTRSIGDLRLKLKQFNNPRELSKDHDFLPPLKIFSGNYITAQPEIKVFQLNKKQKWVLLASDGLWDQLGLQEVAQTFKNNPVDKVPSALIQSCLQKVARQNNKTVQQIKAIPNGKKRKIHDDITIVVLNLEGQGN